MTHVKEVLKRIQAEAEEAKPDLRWVRTCREGDAIRQGDVYLYPLDRVPNHGPVLETRQVAQGESQGSRHIVDGEGTLLERLDGGRDPLAGPYLLAEKRVTLTHPEHAHISLPAGWYEIRYQRDFQEVQRVRAVID